MRSKRKGMITLYDAKARAESFIHHGRISLTPTVSSLYIELMMLEEAIMPKRFSLTRNEFSKWCVAYDKIYIGLGKLGYMSSEIRVGR